METIKAAITAAETTNAKVRKKKDIAKCFAIFPIYSRDVRPVRPPIIARKNTAAPASSEG